MIGRNRCALHGGKTPVGVDASRFKHGRYSKYLPTRLLERYGESLNDPDLLNLIDEIALIDTHICELLEKIYEGGSNGITSANGNPERSEDRPNDLGLWEALHKSVEQRRRLIESENKGREIHGKFYLSEKDAKEFASCFYWLLVDYSPDKEIRDAVVNQIDSYFLSF